MMIAGPVSCGSEAPAEKEPAAQTGGLLVNVVGVGFWPPLPGQSVHILRGLAGQSGEQTAQFYWSPGPMRVVPHQDVAGWIGLEVRNHEGVVAAAGRTPAMIIDSDAPDREVTIFLQRRGAADVVRDEASKPIMLAARVGSSATALPDGSVVIAGGGLPTAGIAPCAGGAPKGLEADIRQLDPLTHKLTVIAKLANARAFHAAMALPGNRVAFTGGYIGDAAAPGTSVEILSANQATVKPAPFGLSKARARHCAVAVGGRLVVVGGDGPGGATAELWDPGTGTVATVALFGARRRPSCELVVDPATGERLIFVIGGDTGGEPDAGVASDLALKIEGSNLTHAGTLPAATPTLRYEAVAATHAPLGVLRLGGIALGVDGHARVQWLQLPGAGYTKVGSLSHARGCGASGVVGRVLVLAGGISGEGQSAALDWLDLADRKPAATQMPTARVGGWVVALPSGAALIGGGTADGLVAMLP